MKYAGEEMLRDFTLNGHWWIPTNPKGAAYGLPVIHEFLESIHTRRLQY